MFGQSPVLKLLKSSLVEVERFLEVFCLDSIGKMFVFAQKKGVKPLLKVDIQHDWTMVRTIDVI